MPNAKCRMEGEGAAFHSAFGIRHSALPFSCVPTNHFLNSLQHPFERNSFPLEPVKIRSLEEIKQELKQLFVENLSLEDLKPEDIGDDTNLFGDGGVGLDSLDGVEIVVLLRRQYGLDVKAMQKGRDIFQSINTLAPYVLANATK